MLNEKLQERYLKLLHVEKQAPTLDYLRLLIKSHLHSIPFENISKFHYYLHRSTTGLEWLPGAEEWMDHVENYGLGGNCYILNTRFGELLHSLGFHTELVRATEGNVHLANWVTVDGRSYYVDVGYGAPLFDPLDLVEEPRFSRRGEEVEITRLEPDRYRIDRKAGGKTFVSKIIEWKPVDLESFGPVITHSNRDEEENPFMRRVVATLFKPEAAYSVINQKLFVKSDQSTEVHEYPYREDWLQMMQSVFGFHRDMLEQALRFLEARGIRLFGDE
jgi:arylamine N-acetyltransferase